MYCTTKVSRPKLNKGVHKDIHACKRCIARIKDTADNRRKKNYIKLKICRSSKHPLTTPPNVIAPHAQKPGASYSAKGRIIGMPNCLVITGRDTEDPWAPLFSLLETGTRDPPSGVR